jgi:adenine phosphoribosyltransferase
MSPDKFKKLIQVWPDFPKSGVLFRDISPLFRDSEALIFVPRVLSESLKSIEFDVVVGIESRGFVVGSLIAMQLKKGLVLIRKAGKLPGPTISQSYEVEYGLAEMEVQKDSILPGQKVVIADDVIASGGTAIAAAKLVEGLGGIIVGFVFMINLKNLGGATKLTDKGFKVEHIFEYE